MAKIKAKKQNLTKKQPQKNNKIDKKKKKLKKKKLDKTLVVPKKEIPTQTPIQNDSDDGDSSSSEIESDKIHELLEPYTKDQLIDFIIEAAVKDPALLARIRDAADLDVSHRKIFVFGLGWDTTRETLLSAFKSYGEIEECTVVTDRATGKAKGYGFVLFKTRQGAIKALKQPRKKVSNRMTSCQLASIGPVPSTQQSHDSAGRKIYVSNVHADVDPEKLRAFFAKFGEIEVGPIGFDMHTGKSRGFALFVYKTQEGARKVLQEPYKMFEGHQLHCQKAADGKNKVVGGGAASVVTAVHPVPAQPPTLAAVAAAQQNLSLFGQNPGFNNPMYSGLLANPNAGMLTAGSVNPMMAAAGNFGQGVYGTSYVGQLSGAGGGPTMGSAAPGLGSYTGATGLGGTHSVLGAHGTSAPTPSGLQYAFPSSQIGQALAAKGPGVGGSFSGYPSQKCAAELEKLSLLFLENRHLKSLSGSTAWL